MGNIIVLGSINMDVVVTAERHPQLGETIFGNSLHFFPGGKGSNQAVAAARLNGTVQLIGRLGDDAFGGTMRSFLTSEGLNMAHVQTIEGASTGTALITVNSDSENTIVVVSGANQTFSAEEMNTVEIKPEDVIVSQLEVPQPAILALFRRAHAVGAITILNPAPAQPFMDGMMSFVSYLIVNETELAFLADTPVTNEQDQLVEAARRLIQGDQTVIVTLGKQGAIAVQKSHVVRIDGRAVKAVDTTGAGDCFVGALAVGLSENMNLTDALTFANYAASISVQRMGAATSLPHRHELD